MCSYITPISSSGLPEVSKTVLFISIHLLLYVYNVLDPSGILATISPIATNAVKVGKDFILLMEYIDIAGSAN